MNPWRLSGHADVAAPSLRLQTVSAPAEVLIAPCIARLTLTGFHREETVDAVKQWLTESGIHKDRVSYSPGWLNFDVSVAEAEKLLKTQYHVYRHGSSGQPHIACEEYSLPQHVSPHVDFITPTVHFDVKVQKPKKKERHLYRRNHEGFIDLMPDPAMDDNMDRMANVQDGIGEPSVCYVCNFS